MRCASRDGIESPLIQIAAFLWWGWERQAEGIVWSLDVVLSNGGSCGGNGRWLVASPLGIATRPRECVNSALQVNRKFQNGVLRLTPSRIRRREELQNVFGGFQNGEDFATLRKSCLIRLRRASGGQTGIRGGSISSFDGVFL
jgi:hypothetical protein